MPLTVILDCSSWIYHYSNCCPIPSVWIQVGVVCGQKTAPLSPIHPHLRTTLSLHPHPHRSPTALRLPKLPLWHLTVSWSHDSLSHMCLTPKWAQQQVCNVYPFSSTSVSVDKFMASIALFSMRYYLVCFSCGC